MDIQVGKKYVSKAFGAIIEVTRITAATVYFRGEKPDECGESDQYCRLATFPNKFDELVSASEPISGEVINTSGTVTGRISCDAPVTSNIPKGPVGDSAMVSVVSMDLSEAELRVLATAEPKAIWEEEPDVKRFRHNGVQCLILRHPKLKTLCGYVRIPHGKWLKRLQKYSRVPTPRFMSKTSVHGPMVYLHHSLKDVDVHGGLTFYGNPSHHFGKRRHWLGFDCAHYMDLIPGMSKYSFAEDHYRNMEYVEQQCRALADQIRKISWKKG